MPYELKNLPWELYALVLQATCLGTHFFLYRRPFGSGSLEAWQRGSRYPALLLCLLAPLAWFGQFPQLLSQALHVATNLCLGTSILEGLFVAARRGPGQDRPSRTLRLRFLRALGYTALLALVGLQAFQQLENDQDVAWAAVATGLVYLGLVLAYDLVFKWKRPNRKVLRTLRLRVRGIAYLLVPGLALNYLFTAWQVVPITRTSLSEYQQMLLGISLAVVGESILVLAFEYAALNSKRPVPQFFRELASASLFLWLGWLYLYRVNDTHLTSLLTSSAFVSVGLGLALKPTLGNLVSGLSLRLARPFDLGDFIEVQGVFGRVHSIDWRSTSISTLSNDVIDLPNSVVARRTLVNYSLPTAEHACYLDFQVSSETPPYLVRGYVLAALASLSEVCRAPGPEVYLMDFGEYALQYRVRYFIASVSRAPCVQTDVHAQVTYTLRRHQLAPQTPNRTWIAKKTTSLKDFE